MTRLKFKIKKNNKAAVIGITAAAVTFMALGAGGVKTYAGLQNAVAPPENGWSADGMYWYENGVKQGTEGRGKEIYDPESDAWYWLDAVQGGKKAVSKDVYQESWAGAYADREDGTGKWVRYDENGHMVKGWTENEDGKYYFDLQTGAMAKGTAAIDNTEYLFNTDTGILYDNEFVTIDGNDYWYENGIRQGTEGRGKEIYDPKTDAWYWLDAVDNGKKAISKDVYQESWAGAYADREDGTGKWVRYDENGRMIKGWNAYGNEGKLTFSIDPNTGASRWDYDPTENDGKMYYFDLQTGAMAKGTTDIDGQTYTFDTNSGVLDVECIKKSGRLYCIEADSRAKAERYKGSNQMDEEIYNALVAACESEFESGDGFEDGIFNYKGYHARYWDIVTEDGVGMITPNGRHGYPYESICSNHAEGEKEGTSNMDDWGFFYAVVIYNAETDKTTATIFVGNQN